MPDPAAAAAPTEPAGPAVPRPRTPVEVFHALVDGVPRLVRGDAAQLDALVALYAERTDVVHPFSPIAAEPLRSQDDLRRHFAAGAARRGGVDSMEAVDRVVHGTADPEVVVGEFRYTGAVGGRPFSAPCIFVLRVRDGQIVESRDYADHARLARAFGLLEEFVSAIVTPGVPAG